MRASDELAGAALGKYEFLGAAAVGGMGEVYAVRHRLLQERRAVKVLREASTADRQLQERFILEARMAARLRHRNLVQLYDLAFHEDGTVYMVLEWIDGLDLARLLREQGPPAIEDALDIAGQALSAVAYLHGESIVHRDISADNLMITRKPSGEVEVKLIDLGIAKCVDTDAGLTQKGLFVGKLRYAAPETLDTKNRPDRPDPRSDLYSFGVVLYELLTGDSPIVGASESEILASHLLGSPRAFEESDPEGRVPEELRAVVLKCLSKRPADRYQSARELYRALGTVDVPAPRAGLSTDLRKTITIAPRELQDLDRPADLDREQDEFNRTMASDPSLVRGGGAREVGTVAGRSRDEVSTEQEIWFSQMRKRYVRRKATTRLSTVVRLIRTHPKPVVLAAALLLLLVLAGSASFLRGGETPVAVPEPTDREIEASLPGVAGPPSGQPGQPGEAASTSSAAAVGEPEPAPRTEETTAVGGGTSPAVVLISDNLQLTAAVRDELKGRVELVVRESLADVLGAAAPRGGPRRAIQLALETHRGSLEAYETSIPSCRAVASGQILALPRGSTLFATSVEKTAPQCKTAIEIATRRLAEELAAQPDLP